MEAIESEGRTVAEAVESALRKLGLRRDQVEVQILQEGSAGFLGMGAKPARVRLTEKLWGEATPSAPKPARERPAPAPVARRPAELPRRSAEAQRAAQPHRAPQPARPPAPVRASTPAVPAAAVVAVDTSKACAETEALLKELFGLMNFDPGALKVAWDPVQERVRCALDGPDAESLASGDGRTLESLQFLLTLMVGRKAGGPVAVQVDALGYWDKREKDIIGQAEKAVAEVKATGKPYRLAPMDAPMRRLIHRSLADHPDVETASEGEGSWRKIVIRPRKI